MAQHISAFALVVPDYDAALAFYVDTLGFDLIEDTPQSESKRWVLVAPKGSQTRILLAKADGAKQRDAIGNQTGGRVGFFLHTDSFEADFIFEPEKEELVKELIPKILKTQFYTYLLDCNASEHGARMVAMDKATDNAGALEKELNLIYNRQRQAAITTQILEIVGGAAALED